MIQRRSGTYWAFDRVLKSTVGFESSGSKRSSSHFREFELTAELEGQKREDN